MCLPYGFVGLWIYLWFGVWLTAKQQASTPTKTVFKDFICFHRSSF
jgi:hypothetical protein